MKNVCTKENPWRPGMPTPVVHPEAYEVGEQQNRWPGGDIVTYRCPNCSHTWRSWNFRSKEPPR
jgi:hypothetical protein